MALPKLENPTYTMVVPSTGNEIEFRPFTVKEQKILLLAKESNDNSAMVRAARDLIANCTMGNVDTSKLTLFDFEYMFLQTRAKSVGETSDIRISCKSCQKYNDVTINVEDARVSGKVERNMKVQLTDSIGIVLTYPKFTDAEKLSKLNDQSATTAIETIICCIESIFDEDNVYPAEDHTDVELREFVDSLSTKQFEEISKLFTKMPAVSLDVGFKCLSCGEDNEMTIEGLNNFF